MQLTRDIVLERELARGAMGTVWIAQHAKLGRVVVKLIIDPDEHLVARFRREATAAARVQGPHIVKIHEHGVTDDGRPYIAMELLEGEDISTRIDREKTLPPDDVVAIVRRIGIALERVHAAGIVHRDIKAENIFLCRDGDVKLLDFGLAKGADNVQMTATGATLGTPDYMSPEQCVGVKELDGRADLWSVGVLTYLMLTGKFPFVGKTVQQLTLAIFHGEIIPITQHNPALPPAIDAWFTKACARDRDLRYQTAMELSDALQAVFARVPAIAERVSTRSPMLMVSVAFVVGLAAALIAFALFR
jgi:eukaryotic-like serine/threonine-protein kinase